MVLRAEFTMHQSDLGDFLSGTAWEEQDGSAVSILSAFARLDLDPWQEAARLAAMPRDAAAVALAKALALLRPADRGSADGMALARRLVETLPKRPPSQLRVLRPARRPSAPSAPTSTGWVSTLALLLVGALALGFLQAVGRLF